MWKLANVAPIFKNGNKQLIKNYRPISILPVCGKILEKILEKIIFNNLYTYNQKSIGFSSRRFHN